MIPGKVYAAERQNLVELGGLSVLQEDLGLVLTARPPPAKVTGTLLPGDGTLWLGAPSCVVWEAVK